MARTPTKPTWRALQASTTHGKHSNQASFITYHHTWSSRCDDSHPTVREERTTLHELHYTQAPNARELWSSSTTECELWSSSTTSWCSSSSVTVQGKMKLGGVLARAREGKQCVLA